MICVSTPPVTAPFGRYRLVERGILTNEISKATFGVEIKDHKKIKALDPKFKNENLRDHMTNLELIFNMLGEASTTEIAKKKNAQGFDENKVAAKDGGKIAGDARKNLEIKTGEKVDAKTQGNDYRFRCNFAKRHR